MVSVARVIVHDICVWYDVSYDDDVNINDAEGE